MKNILKFTLIAAFTCCYLNSLGQSSDAQYPGGMGKFFAYVKSNLQYPEAARNDSIRGEVYLKFLVASSGEIQEESIEILEGLCPSCDSEAIRLIRESSPWIPAQNGDGPVDYQISLVIRIEPDDQ